MAFFIRQVDRRFSATTALGWAFFNMLLTVVIAFGFEFETTAALEASLFIPIFCGLWIVFFTLGALTLDSNVLLACRGFSKPLRNMLKPGSKDSKERTPKNVSTSGDPEQNSDAKASHSSTIFVVNREMFPTKYNDFDNELLEQILEELKFQVTLVRRALIPASPGSTSTTIELTDSDRRRNSTKVDSGRFSSKSRFTLVPPATESRGSSSNSSNSPTDVTLVLPESLTSTESRESGETLPQHATVMLPEPSAQTTTHSDNTSSEV